MSFVWPNGARGAVALTYDDALRSHRELVAPALERRDLRATFYLMAHALERDDIEGWRAVAARGHELGNHSLFHPCRKDPERRFDWLPDEYDLRSYTIEKLRLELRTMNLLLGLIDGETERSYGNTCSDVTVGDGEDEIPMRGLLAELFVGARGGIAGRHVAPAVADLFQLAGYSGDGKGFPTLRAEIEEAVETGGLTTYMIHGVGEGTHHLFIDTDEHERLLEWLDSERDRVWVAPLREVAAWIRSHR